MSERIRLNLVSEIALEQDGSGRPIHMLRAGTFTDSLGRETTFTDEDIAHIAQHSARRNPPITESHDFGRAVGRITRRWIGPGGLYGQPAWNRFGRDLLTERVYDGFSIELDRADTGWTMIGGSLTNYPAVDGLEPVALQAPPIEFHALRAAAPHEEIPMADDTPITETPAEVAPPVTLDAAVHAAIGGLALSQDMAARIADMVSVSVRQQFDAVRQQAETEARAQIARFQREQQIVALAQHFTTPTLQRQHALPMDADRLGRFLIGLSEAQRAEATALFESILTSGLVSFEEIGSTREGEDTDSAESVIAEFERVRDAKRASGMDNAGATEAAIVAVGKDRYNAARAQARKGGR